jgi:hypothetical protein
MQGWRVGRHRDSKILLAQNNCFSLFIYFSRIVHTLRESDTQWIQKLSNAEWIMLPRESFLALSFLLLCSVIRGSEDIFVTAALCIIVRKKSSLALSLLSGFICPRKQKPAGSIGGKMPKTVVTLRRILTVIIPFIYIFFVTGTFILLWYMHTVKKTYLPRKQQYWTREKESVKRKNMLHLVCGTCRA